MIARKKRWLWSVFSIALLAVILGGQFVYLGAESNDDDLLQIVLAGTKNAVSSIKSLKGRVTVYDSTTVLNAGTKGIHETEDIYNLVFSGTKYRISAEHTVMRSDYIPGLKLDTLGIKKLSEKAFDDTKVVVLKDKTARIGDALTDPKAMSELSSTLEWIGNTGRMIPGNGLVSLDDLKTSNSPAISSITFRIIRREDINGSECIVIERHANRSNTTLANMIDVFWVDPNKGFTVPRVRRFYEGGSYSERTLYHEVNTDLREYSPGVWYPTRIESMRYQKDAEGQTFVSDTTVVTYDPQFQVNVPVTASELTLVLPSGTQVYDSILDAEYTVP